MGCTFFIKKVDDLFLVVARKGGLNIPPNITRPAKKCHKIDSYSGWGCTSCPGGVLTHFSCKLRLKKNFSPPWGCRCTHCTPGYAYMQCCMFIQRRRESVRRLLRAQHDVGQTQLWTSSRRLSSRPQRQTQPSSARPRQGKLIASAADCETELFQLRASGSGHWMIRTHKKIWIERVAEIIFLTLWFRLFIHNFFLLGVTPWRVSPGAVPLVTPLC